jgi:hypothetical protein
MHLIYKPDLLETINAELDKAYKSGREVSKVILDRKERHQLYCLMKGKVDYIAHDKLGFVEIGKPLGELLTDVCGGK